MGLYHHGVKLLHCWVSLKTLCLGFGLRSPGDTSSTVHLFGNCLNSLPERHLQRVEEFQVHFVFASFHDDVGELKGAVPTFKPVLRKRTTGSCLLGILTDHCDFVFGVGMEGIDAYHWIDS